MGITQRLIWEDWDWATVQTRDRYRILVQSSPLPVAELRHVLG
jgi:hypothetical protein